MCVLKRKERETNSEENFVQERERMCVCAKERECVCVSKEHVCLKGR
jgi:hypothetical protein